MKNSNIKPEINIYSKFGNDVTLGTKVLIKTMSASGSTKGPFGLPRGNVLFN